MRATKAVNVACALLVGAVMGPLCGNIFFGAACGAVLMAAIGLVLFCRQQHLLGRRHEQQLLLHKAVAERALRQGDVICCCHCQRAMRREAHRCLFCGLPRLEGLLR